MRPTDERERPPQGDHASEGELHAFLDGAVDGLGSTRAAEVRAHCRRCIACRDRLAVEAAVRERASALLGAVDPLDVVDLPSLADLEARAGVAATGTASREGGRAGLEASETGEPSSSPGAPGVPDAGRGRGPWWRPAWAWAATVVLSLGVGYGIGAFGSAGAGGPAARAPGSGTAGSTAPEAGAGAVAPDVAAEASPAPPRADEAGGAAASVAEADDPRALSASTGAEPEGSQDGSGARAAPVSREAVRSDTAAGQLVDERTATGTPALALRSSAVSDTAPREVAGDRAIPAATASPEREAPGARRADSDAVGRGGGEGGAPASAPAGLTLEGLVVTGVRFGEVWPGQDGVVVIHRLDDGRLDDGRLVEVRAAGRPVGRDGPVLEPPTVPPGAASGWVRVARRVDGGWLVVDGPLPREVLAELLATLR